MRSDDINRDTKITHLLVHVFSSLTPGPSFPSAMGSHPPECLPCFEDASEEENVSEHAIACHPIEWGTFSSSSPYDYPRATC